jgi:predicted Zn-dependent protease
VPFSELEGQFRALAPPVEFCSLRAVRERAERLSVRRGVVQPVRRSEDWGAMVTVAEGGGLGYAATADLTRAGLVRAIEAARAWARSTAGRSLVEAAALEREVRRGEYRSPVARAWGALALAEKLELLGRASAGLQGDARIVDWQAALGRLEHETLFLTADGSRVFQRQEFLFPSLSATAHRHGDTQSRSLGGGMHLHQGGLEVLERIGFESAAPRLREQALELLAAPDCPQGVMDLVLAPDQMVLQIHESIGHPLELDRILGDERNYAGTSFVTPEMFGRYRYGSELLNVTFDPTLAGELASYAYDDEGRPARREHLIRDGVLLRPLGGGVSQARAGLPGVANARANGWQRPPIDRMANLNLEPGTQSLAELIASVGRGVYMETNCSWSIDDSRNKFQFGCERARLIENGELGPVVKNPNYRGISATFWRSLAGVGDTASFEVLGVGTCGKGEPNQMIRVGHASPPCLFRNVEVFGGA